MYLKTKGIECNPRLLEYPHSLTLLWPKDSDAINAL